MQLRSRSPGRFCVAACLFFSATACVGHLVSGPLLLYSLLVASFFSPVLLPALAALAAASSATAAEQHVSGQALFEPFSRDRGEGAPSSLDRELGIVAEDGERHGSRSSSSRSSIRIVSSHFSGRQDSVSDDGDDVEDANTSADEPDEPFEMISDADADLHTDHPRHTHHHATQGHS